MASHRCIAARGRWRGPPLLTGCQTPFTHFNGARRWSNYALQYIDGDDVGSGSRARMRARMPPRQKSLKKQTQIAFRCGSGLGWRDGMLGLLPESVRRLNPDDPDPCNDPPEKPKGMHWSTYDRL